MNYNRILKHLYSLESPKIKLGLENIQNLLGKIGNPEKELKCIHVAGTNGKGSVCAMLFYILREAGCKVGMYTSPHLKRFNERIRINGHFISDKDIVEYFLKIKPHITSQSFFEITTAIAFLYFKEKKVEFAVVEVGLGGRLDATNVINPLISVIIGIGIEHSEILGNSLKKIAYEKSGIIKENVPVVASAHGKALATIKKISKNKNSPLILTKKYKKIKFKHLNGEFQQDNKDIALTTIDALRKNKIIGIDKNKTINGIKKTKWPARLEFIEKNVLVDCAHNAPGFEVLKKELLLIKKRKKIDKFVFVVGIQKTKDIKTMLITIKPLISTIIFTKSNNAKAANPGYLLQTFNKISKNKFINRKIIKNPKKALNYAKKISSKQDLVVVAGSIYLAGEIIKKV